MIEAQGRFSNLFLRKSQDDDPGCHRADDGCSIAEGCDRGLIPPQAQVIEAMTEAVSAVEERQRDQGEEVELGGRMGE
jgi:hypothetical protein